jgi:hypothetical protein
LDLGFINDRVILSTAFFRNRSDNLLIAYQLPIQTGFGNIAAKNFPALVQNTGFEIALQSKNVVKRKFTWTTSANITIPKNKLVSFPNLASSSYKSFLVEGQSMSTARYLSYNGVNAASGVFDFIDADSNGVVSFPNDYTKLKNTDPRFYGGLQNTLTWKNFQLDFFFEFRKQLGLNYLFTIYDANINAGPGTILNQPAVVLDRWRKPGDITNIQMYSATAGSPAFNVLNYFHTSDAVLSDASYIKLRTAGVYYTLPATWLKSLHIEKSRVYVQGQNLFTITNYKYSDPTVQNIRVLSPLRTIIAGLQLNF